MTGLRAALRRPRNIALIVTMTIAVIGVGAYAVRGSAVPDLPTAEV